MNAIVQFILVLFTLNNTALLLLLVSKFYELSKLGEEAKRIGSKIIPASFNLGKPKGRITKRSEEDLYWDEKEKNGERVWKD